MPDVSDNRFRTVRRGNPDIVPGENDTPFLDPYVQDWDRKCSHET
jgi:hypothetical protein